MAAASFLVPSLSGLNSRPNRIRHSVRVNIRRRERITPPPIVTSKRLSSMQVINCFVVQSSCSSFLRWPLRVSFLFLSFLFKCTMGSFNFPDVGIQSSDPRCRKATILPTNPQPLPVGFLQLIFLPNIIKWKAAENDFLTASKNENLAKFIVSLWNSIND